MMLNFPRNLGVQPLKTVNPQLEADEKTDEKALTPDGVRKTGASDERLQRNIREIEQRAQDSKARALAGVAKALSRKIALAKAQLGKGDIGRAMFMLSEVAESLAMIVSDMASLPLSSIAGQVMVEVGRVQTEMSETYDLLYEELDKILDKQERSTANTVQKLRNIFKGQSQVPLAIQATPSNASDYTDIDSGNAHSLQKSISAKIEASLIQQAMTPIQEQYRALLGEIETIQQQGANDGTSQAMMLQKQDRANRLAGILANASR